MTDPTLRAVTSRWSALALVLLVANDHVFKEAIPGLLTGKLSDLAGLFVFPLLLLTIWLPVIDVSGRRALAALPFAITGLVFACLKVDAAISRSIVDSINRVTGMSVGIVADPTDLVALSSIAAAYVYWRHQLTRPVATETSTRPSRGRLAAVLLVGALATVATSRFPPTEVIALSAHPSAPGDLFALVSPESPSREDENGSL